MTFRAIPALLALILSASTVQAAQEPAPKTTISAKPDKAKAKPAAKATAKAAPKPAAPEPPVTVDGLLAKAKDATVKGDTDLAVRMAQSAIVHDPARTSSYVALGDIYAAAGQPDFARSYYDAALGIDPGDKGALRARAAIDRDHPEATARNSK
jgi:tetratricopeptide (TPR) repeat protein